MMVTIENGFAEVGAGAWLMGQAQPVAFFGEVIRRRMGGWLVRDRSALWLVETTGRAKCADASRPFLTHIPCAAPVSAISSKVLLAPAAARTGAELVKPVPMSHLGELCVTQFAQGAEGQGQEAEAGGPAGEPAGRRFSWLVLATASRTARLAVADGETLSARPEAVVAWTGNRPTGFVRRLGVWDVILPRFPREMMLHFHGPCVVWVEGACKAGLISRVPRQFQGRAYHGL